MQEQLDTKTRIFHAALRLFAQSGVENVSMRDLADVAGIQAGSIYNHYKNKEELVEACYAFFLKYHDSTKLQREEYLPILETGTKEEVLSALNYRVPLEVLKYLIPAMIVLFSRIHTDATARDYYTKMIDRSIQFLREYFEAGIQVGRFKEFDIMGASMIFQAARLFIAQSVSVQSTEIDDWTNAETKMFSVLPDFLPFQY